MGEYINLIAAMNRKHSDAPSVVCQRYACDQPQTTVNFTVKADTRWGDNIYLVGNHPLLSEWAPAAAIKMSPDSWPLWNVTVSARRHVLRVPLREARRQRQDRLGERQQPQLHDAGEWRSQLG